MEGEDVVGAFFEDDWFGGYGVCGGLRRRENMVVVVVVVVAVVGGGEVEVSDVDGYGREWGCF